MTERSAFGESMACSRYSVTDFTNALKSFKSGMQAAKEKSAS